MSNSQSIRIKAHLQEWARKYGDGAQRLPDSGRIIELEPGQKLEPSATPVADAIQAIVQRMEAQGRWKEARVLRAEFVLEALTEGERLQRLSRSGLRIGRSAYYVYLKSALAVVEFTLSASSQD